MAHDRCVSPPSLRPALSSCFEAGADVASLASAGDICTRDSDGWYRVIDRNKDLIKYKGAFDPAMSLTAALSD